MIFRYNIKSHIKNDVDFSKIHVTTTSIENKDISVGINTERTAQFVDREIPYLGILTISENANTQIMNNNEEINIDPYLDTMSTMMVNTEPQIERLNYYRKN